MPSKKFVAPKSSLSLCQKLLSRWQRQHSRQHVSSTDTTVHNPIYQLKAPLFLVYVKILSRALLLRSRYISCSVTSAAEAVTLKNGQDSQLGQLGFSSHCQIWQRSQTRALNFTYIICSCCINSFLSVFTALANICGYHIAYCLAKLASDRNWREFREKKHNEFVTNSSGNDIPRNRAQLVQDPAERSTAASLLHTRK